MLADKKLYGFTKKFEETTKNDTQILTTTIFMPLSALFLKFFYLVTTRLSVANIFR